MSEREIAATGRRIFRFPPDPTLKLTSYTNVWMVRVLRRAIIVMRPGLENNFVDPSKNLTFLAYTLERAAVQSASAGGDGRYIVIIDYAAGNFSLRHAPSLSTSKATLAIIQNHYPERLAAAFLCDSPSYFYPTFRLVKPFIDPVTASKSENGVFIFPRGS